jgi:hypothetical protein
MSTKADHRSDKQFTDLQRLPAPDTTTSSAPAPQHVEPIPELAGKESPTPFLLLFLFVALGALLMAMLSRSSRSFRGVRPSAIGNLILGVVFAIAVAVLVFAPIPWRDIGRAMLK